MKKTFQQNNLENFQNIWSPLRRGLEYSDCKLWKGIRHSVKKKYPKYGTKQTPVVRLQFWSSGECGVPFYFLYYQVHSSPEYLYESNRYAWKWSILDCNVWSHVTVSNLFVWDMNNGTHITVALWLTCWFATSPFASSNISHAITLTFGLILLGKLWTLITPSYRLNITTTLQQGWLWH